MIYPADSIEMLHVEPKPKSSVRDCWKQRYCILNESHGITTAFVKCDTQNPLFMTQIKTQPYQFSQTGNNFSFHLGYKLNLMNHLNRTDC